MDSVISDLVGSVGAEGHLATSTEFLAFLMCK